MTAALNITARQLKALVAPVLPLAGRDDMLPVLTAIRVEVDGPWLIAMATDRFRLGIKRLRAVEDEPWPAGWSATIPVRTLKGILAAFKPSYREGDAQLVLTVDDDQHSLHVVAGGALLDMLGASITYPLETGEYPKLRTLIRTGLAAPVAEDGIAGFNWALLSEFRAAAPTHGGPLVIRVGAGANPTLISDGEDFIGAIMPRRMVGNDSVKGSAFPSVEDWNDVLGDPKKATVKKKPAAKKATVKKAAMAGAR